MGTHDIASWDDAARFQPVCQQPKREIVDRACGGPAECEYAAPFGRHDAGSVRVPERDVSRGGSVLR